MLKRSWSRCRSYTGLVPGGSTHWSVTHCWWTDQCCLKRKICGFFFLWNRKKLTKWDGKKIWLSLQCYKTMVPMKVADAVLNVLRHRKVLTVECGSSGVWTINWLHFIEKLVRAIKTWTPLSAFDSCQEEVHNFIDTCLNLYYLGCAWHNYVWFDSFAKRFSGKFYLHNGLILSLFGFVL